MKAIGAAALAATLLMSASGIARAADLIIDDAAVVPAYEEVAADDWAGAFIGANVGFGSGTVTYEGNFDGEYDLSGWTAGVQAGVNGQSGNLVYGVEGTLDWSGITGEDPDYNGNVYRDIHWTGSLTGKVGFAVDSLLFYGKAGLAFANTTGYVYSTEINQTHTGWTAGLGVAAKITDSMSAFVEYDYSDYGAEFYDYGNPEVDTGFTTGVIKAGLNWHF